MNSPSSISQLFIMSASLMQTCPCHAPGDDPAEITTLHQAAFHQNNQRLEELLQDNADVSATQTPRDFTPLHYAVQFGDEKSVQLLIDAGSNVSARSYDGVTPLHNTSAGGNVRITEMLLKAGANVESRNIDEETPLHVVSLFGETQITELLIDAGADVSAKAVIHFCIALRRAHLN